MAWWVKYLPHEADGLCVTRTQIKVEGNQLPASTVSHVRMPPTQSKVIFKNGADSQRAKGLADEQRDRRETDTRKRNIRHF